MAQKKNKQIDHKKDRERRQRLNQFKKRVEEFVRRNLILSVLIALVISWLVVSYAVFRAEEGVTGANITNYPTALWWGIVTFLTVGYGDYTPLTAFGRLWAGCLMVVGVFGVAIITSKISSYFMEQALREGRGNVTTSKLKDHFIICGWKDDMAAILSHILDFNPELKSSDIVMIATVDQAEVDNLREDPELRDLKVIIGNYYDQNILKRAAPERARKVMILADRSRSQAGEVASVTEVDARTIMTAMTLHNIARNTLVTAEILDSKMDQYLKLASVSEIIYSREYSRLLLGNASGGTGISNIVYDLLDPRNPTRIVTLHIEEELFEKSYAEFKSAFEAESPGAIVIGILENTGNRQKIKEAALRHAQKTPDVGRLVENLKAVRNLRCNHPVFNPEPGYIVHEGAMAIVIETQDYGEARNAGAQAAA